MYGSEVLNIHDEIDAGFPEDVVLQLLQQKISVDTIFRKYLGSWLFEKIKDFLGDKIFETELRAYANQFAEAIGLIRFGFQEYAKPIGLIVLQMADDSQDECYLRPIRFCLLALGFKVINDGNDGPFNDVADNIEPDLTIYATRSSFKIDYRHQEKIGSTQGKKVIFLSDTQSNLKSHEFSLKDFLYHTMQLAIEIRKWKFSNLHSWSHSDKVETTIESAYQDVIYRFTHLYSLSYDHIFFDEFLAPLIEAELRCANGKEQIELLGTGNDWVLALDQYMFVHGDLSARQYDPVEDWPFRKVLKRYHKKK